MIDKLFNVNDAAKKAEELTAENERLIKSEAEQTEIATELATKIEALEADAQTANEQLETALARVKALEADAQTVEQAAAEQAADVVARLGVDEPASANPSDEKTVDELWSEYNALAGSEKNAFYAANRNRLFNNR